MSYSFREAQERADDLTEKIGPTSSYDRVRTEAINPTDPDSRVRVLVRRRDDHVIEEEV